MELGPKYRKGLQHGVKEGRIRVSLNGAAGGSMGTNKMSINQRKQLVYELSKNSEITFKKVLQDWPCDEIRELLCAESEKVRKYTGLTKHEIIKKLFKIVSKKSTGGGEVKEKNSSPKRQRKDPDPLHDVTPSAYTKEKGTIRCKNLACQAKLTRVDTFCRRCSCCICHKYDNNKDPSHWLTCTSDPSFDVDETCGLSCHLHCAFKSDKSGIHEDKEASDVDGCFICVSCGTPSSILECLKKHILIAKEERRVNEFCLRLLLAQKLLKGTKKYREISEHVEKAVKELQTEFGGDPLTSPPSNTSRVVVNRLVCATNVKKYCCSALELIDKLPLPAKTQRSSNIRFVNVLASSMTLVVGKEDSSLSRTTNVHYSVWHRKISEQDYPKDSTCELFSPNTRFVVSGLTPATEYCFKVVCSSGTKELSVDESKVSTKTLEYEEEVALLINFSSSSTKCNNLSPPRPSLVQTDFNSEGERVSTITGSADVIQMKKNDSCKLVLENLSKDTPENADRVEDVAGCSSFGFEHCVKFIRQLECSGKVTSEFRQKFLTWYSLRATAMEKYVVETFIDTFKEDTAALAEQLIHTFSDCISRKRHAVDDGGI